MRVAVDIYCFTSRLSPHSPLPIPGWSIIKVYMHPGGGRIKTISRHQQLKVTTYGDDIKRCTRRCGGIVGV